jgi:hypothetical protein
MSVGDAMLVLDRGQCREGGAENNCSGKRSYFYLAEHFYLHRRPPVIGGPFCAIASEVPPASNAATIVRVRSGATNPAGYAKGLNDHKLNNSHIVPKWVR